MMFRITAFFLLLGLSLPVFSQTSRLEAYKARLVQTPAPADQLPVLLDICREKYSLSGDSLCRYAARARDIAESLNDRHSYYAACNYYAQGLSIRGDLDSCDTYVRYYIDLLEGKEAYRSQRIHFQLSAASNNYKNGHPKISLASMYELLQEVDGREFKIDILNEIALAYGGMEHFAEQIEWINRSLALNPAPATIGEKAAYARSLSNKSIAFIHLYEQTGTKAFADSTYRLAGEVERFSKANEILFFYGQALIMKGYYYSYMGNPTAAENYLKMGLEVRKTSNEPTFIVSDMTVLATFYAKTGQTDKGIALCQEALALCKEKKLGLMVVTLVYKTLGYNYEAAGRHRELAGTLSLLLSLRDSLYLRNLDGEIEKLDAVYNLQKQEIELARKEASLNKKNFQFYIILVIALSLAVSAGTWFSGYRKNQRLKLRYVQEEEKRKADLAVREAEENERKRLAADLHDHLGVQANVILHTVEQLGAGRQLSSPLISHLNDSAKDMLFFLRETLWALKATDVSAENTWLRILNFISRMKRTYTEIHFEVSGSPPPHRLLPSASALNVLMIIQEAVNNAVRHSGGTEIKVVTGVNGDTWIITVQDNGKGFTPDETGSENYGLANMKRRAQSSGFGFRILRQGGTAIRIEIKSIQKEY